jgi:signal transduction histidine kinase
MGIHPRHVAAVLHLAGFLAGLSLYGMLAALAARTRDRMSAPSGRDASIDMLAVLTGILGVTWNAGAMVVHGLADLGLDEPPISLAVATYAALGFLPAAATHSVIRSSRLPSERRPGLWIVALAYGLSSVAAVLHVVTAARGFALPSGTAFRLLTAGYLTLAVPLVVVARRQALWRRTVLVVALGVFGVSAVHLVVHQQFTRPLWVQILGHHASLPLAVVILLQDYPFAFGDILLKRMLSFGALVTMSLAGFFAVLRLPVVREVGVGADLDHPQFVAALLGLMAGVALLYPWMRAAIGAWVDRAVLRRSDPAVVMADLTRLVSECEGVDTLIAEGGRILTAALSAPTAVWTVTGDDAGRVALEPDGRTVRVVIPTAEAPRPTTVIGPLAGGRRFLAADVALLRDASQALASRVDAIRIAQERVERRWREQELARLTVDAELRALRAQVNPHFLFNALTTIGYLVKASPDRAVHTLLRLTDLLRRVLRSDEDLVTLASELQMVEAYLDIERARFEDRLQVAIDVPEDTQRCTLPVFVLQPLVENAVKHGIAPSRTGGLVSIRACLMAGADGPLLELVVSDTGRGRTTHDSGHEGQGIGLANVRRRLDLAYGHRASVSLTSDGESGTRVVVILPARTPGAPDTPTS